MALVTWDTGRIKTLAIADGQEESDILDLGGKGTRRAYVVGIIAPPALTGIVSIKVSHSAGGPFSALQSDNVDVALSAGKATTLNPFAFPYLSLSSSLPEGADRNFIVIATGA